MFCKRGDGVWVVGGSTLRRAIGRSTIIVIAMTKPKRHHFLPEFYLNGFARDGLLAVFDREKNEYRSQPPKNTAVIGHFYAFHNTAGELDYGLETFFSQIEGNAKPVIEKLEQGSTIEAQERIDFGLFLAVLFNRVPKFEREIDEIADAAGKAMMKKMFPSVEAIEEHFRREADADRSYSAQHFYDFIHKEQYSFVGNRDLTIRTMLEQTPEIAKTLTLMDWAVAHADDRSSFITTDSPFGFIVPEEIKRSGEPALGVSSPKVTKIIPLSRRIAFLLGGFGAGFGHFNFSRPDVRELNVAVATECDRYIIGPDEALVRSVVKRSKVDREKPGTRMKVDHIQHPTDENRTMLITRRVTADTPDKPLKVIFED